MSIAEYDVAIVGLGPTGAVLAHLLGGRGLAVLVLEREPRFYGNARAVYTDDECMRILQWAGVADEVARDMQRDTMIQLVRSDGRKLMQYWSPDRSHGWPVSNFLYQPHLETRLLELLGRHSTVQVLRGRELVDFRQDDEGVELTHQATRSFRFDEGSDARTEIQVDADSRTVRARYLIGADGGRSTVRETLGIGMDGKSFPQPWLVVDLEVKPGTHALHHQPYFQFVCDPVRPTVNCTQPYPYHRLEFMMMPGQSREELIHPDTVRRLVSRYVDLDQFEVRRTLVYTFNALITRQWRQGRILLAGDAAHMTPQFIGQGMSAGIRDAANLAWKLDAVLRGHAGEALLDSYGSERHPHVRAMIRIAVLLKNVVSVSNPALAFLRDAILFLGTRTPWLRGWIRTGGFKPKPRYRRGLYLGLSRGWRTTGAGTLMPQPQVRSFDGKELRLDDLLGTGFVLLGLGVDPRHGLSHASHELLQSLDTRYATLYTLGGRPQGAAAGEPGAAEGLIEVEEIGQALSGWFRRAGFRRNAIAIVRPDHFAFAVVDAARLETAIGALREQLHWQERKPSQTVTPTPMASVAEIHRQTA